MKLLDENRMCSVDYIKMLETIETLFQTAIAGNHNVLVLTAFGNTIDDVPQEDIAKIYNHCIFKYGHRFKKIIIYFFMCVIYLRLFYLFYLRLDS